MRPILQFPADVVTLLKKISLENFLFFRSEIHINYFAFISVICNNLSYFYYITVIFAFDFLIFIFLAIPSYNLLVTDFMQVTFLTNYGNFDIHDICMSTHNMYVHKIRITR